VIAVPHYFFWPFDVGISKIDRERTRARTHIADPYRDAALSASRAT